MTFEQLVWKMAKVNKRKYLFYFLCNMFAVMIFFMFSTVFFNEGINEAKEMGEGFTEILMIPAIALVLFTIFFISSAHSIFIKRRKKEFGLFMTLGMSFRDIARLLLIENGVIALAAIVSGLGTGAIFSRLFFLLLMKGVELETITFHFSHNMFIVPIGIYLLVFMIAIGKTLWITRNRDLASSIKGDRMSERNTMKNPFIGGIGLSLAIASVFVLYHFSYHEQYKIDEGKLFIYCTIGLLIGLYFTISQLGSFIIGLAKKKRAFYYKRLLFLTNVDYKFKQLKSTLMLIITMAMVTIFYSTLMLFFFSSAEETALQQPFDIAFVQTEQKNQIDDAVLYDIVDQPEHRLQQHETLDVFEFYEILPGWVYEYRFVIMKVDDFNEVAENKVEVKEGEFVSLINSNFEYSTPLENGLTIPMDNATVSLTYTGSVNQQVFNHLPYFDQEFIIVHENDYTNLSSSIEGYRSTIHLFTVTDWKQTALAVETLNETLQRLNELTGPLDEKMTGGSVYEEELMTPMTRIDQYQEQKTAAGLLFFISTFLSVLFFFGTFILLYLNIFTDIEVEKQKYQKLYKIGITRKEMKKMISKELRMLFFVAPIVGIGLGFVYIATLAKDGGGRILENPILLHNFFIIGSMYLLLQIIYYVLARQKYMNEVMRN
ncbi:ABC transporter permease [Alkalihalobacillus sp. LMS39]|uniref:FtsX-like permease family protein n=1 Tax=Alkalihalobacillus sp. LMS39 TaxID=2924032 RepID=UPI001FB52CAD|nr:ABC transporter permease [Alkalihalobacillus sp. LMS39]UOE95765.1 ABC transporter permease [Alkalihalobacillus sp. LMS39]